MPGLQFKQLPTNRTGSPSDIVERQSRDMQSSLHRQFRASMSALEQQYMSDREFKNKAIALQVQYRTAVGKQQTKSKQQMGELKTRQRLMDEGVINPDAGQKAMWRLVLPSETGAAMFPKGPSARPFSPGQLENYKGMMETFALSGKEEPGIEWGKPVRTQETLIGQYLKAREHAGYDDPSWTPTQKRQFDTEWDALMAGASYLHWNPLAPEVRAVRAKGKLQEAVAKQITPLAASVAKAKMVRGGRPMYGWAEHGMQIRRPGGKTLTRTQAKDLYLEAGGDKEVARKLARERGFKL